ncbi:MAG: type II/IV secretion system protein [Clostridiales bacterium]|nr:type II/IV secretion system protein [Clostridiales bacterium]
MAYKRLGDLLVSVGLITNEQLGEALKISKNQGKRLGTVLIETGVITELQLIDVLKIQLGVEFVDLAKMDIPLSLANMVPKNIARKYTVVPVRAVGGELYLAMVDPLNFVAIEEVKSVTKKRVIPMIATASATERAIAALYGAEGVSRAIDELQRDLVNDENAVTEAATTPLDLEEGQSAPTIRLVNSIIERAVSENASDIHLEPCEGGMIVRMRVDGVLHQILTMPKNLQASITSRIKIMGAIDIAERRIPQDGRANVRVRQKDVDLRISTLPTIYGEKIVVRLLMKSEQLLTSAGIGLVGENLEKYQDLIRNSNGVILIVGPTGSGKSSSMYTMIQDLNRDEVNLVTLEDPVEYNLDRINQVQINEKVGMSFASGLRAILRQDPDIIAVGEIRDGETAEIAMRAAITGHLVLSTLHTSDAVSTLDRLVDIGIEPYLIASALKGIISQRLVRKICPHCREAYKPTEDELDLLELPAGDYTFYRGKGCSECMETGYRGRTATFEILTMTTEIKRKFRDRVPQNQLMEAVERSGFKSMLVDCRKLVLAGVTTSEEASRILHTTD